MPKKKHIFSNFFSSLIWNARLVPKMTFARYWVEESTISLIRGIASPTITSSKCEPEFVEKMNRHTHCGGKIKLDLTDWV